jgi:structural maintenance of chromosome 4
VSILEIYRDKRREFVKKEKDLRLLEENLGMRKQELDNLRQKRLEEFKEGFSLIAKHVKEIYRLITNGGDADLETIDQLDPFSEGVMFQVRPKNKSWKQMSKLSGGEKTLSSLSLIFALHIFKPSPLYCMDEIDAALDYKNVAIVGKYIKEGVCKRTQTQAASITDSATKQVLENTAKAARNSQFIIISLRNNMFELADKLVGIYKTHDVTQTITINPALIWANIQAETEK